MGPTGLTGSEVLYEEENMIKQGIIQWENRKKKRNYLHPRKGSLGSNLGAGLFVKPKLK
jgi:hypothetical protein